MKDFPANYFSFFRIKIRFGRSHSCSFVCSNTHTLFGTLFHSSFWPQLFGVLYRWNSENTCRCCDNDVDANDIVVLWNDTNGAHTHTSDQHITLGIGVQPPLQIPVPLLHIAIERKVTVAATVATTTTTALNSQIEEEKVPRSIYGRKDLQKKNRETRCNEIDEICITHTSSLPLILKNAHSYDLTIKSRR